MTVTSSIDHAHYCIAPPTHMAELGALDCEFGLLARAHGSARVVQGTTSVLAAVYGPVEAKSSKEKWDRWVMSVLIHDTSAVSFLSARQSHAGGGRTAGERAVRTT